MVFFRQSQLTIKKRQSSDNMPSRKVTYIRYQPTPIKLQHRRYRQSQCEAGEAETVRLWNFHGFVCEDPWSLCTKSISWCELPTIFRERYFVVDNWCCFKYGLCFFGLDLYAPQHGRFQIRSNFFCVIICVRKQHNTWKCMCIFGTCRVLHWCIISLGWCVFFSAVIWLKKCPLANIPTSCITWSRLGFNLAILMGNTFTTSWIIVYKLVLIEWDVCVWGWGIIRSCYRLLNLLWLHWHYITRQSIRQFHVSILSA